MIKPYLILTCILGFTLAILPFRVSANPLSAVVSSIVDGDTITLNQGGRAIRVQLACINTPDWINGQPEQNTQSQASKDRLTALLPVGSSVQYYDVGRVSGRVLAVVFNQNQNINLQMVVEGQARLHPSYARTCTNSADALALAERNAQSQRLGLWNR